MPASPAGPRGWLARSVLVLALVGACGPTGPASPTPGNPSPTASGPASASPSPVASSPPPASGPSQSPPAPSLPVGVSVDPGLLEVLPTAVDGVALEPDPATATQIAGDLLLADSAISIAVALAVAPGLGSDDVAVASVVRLHPDVFDEAFYQEWRDTYDDAACEVADGVESTDETDIAGRLVYVATCTGGAMTYHTFLEDQVFFVSVTASGQRHLGELIMAGLAR
jgi:hypothetical protein